MNTLDEDVLRTERVALKGKVDRVLDQEIHARNHQRVLDRVDGFELMGGYRYTRLEESSGAHESIARERDIAAGDVVTARLLKQAFVRQLDAGMGIGGDQDRGVGDRDV